MSGFDKRRVLVLAPHTDDGEFGCGGSIARFLDEGKEVFYVAFSTAEQSVPEGFASNALEIEVRNATKILGIRPDHLIVYGYEVRKLNYVRQEVLEELVKIKREIEPDLVFLPSGDDLHQDHQTVHMEGLRAFKQTTILGYELPWNTITFHARAFVSLDDAHLEKKVAALKAYESQAGRPYASEEFLRSWARTRGTQIGTRYAESFDVIRWVV